MRNKVAMPYVKGKVQGAAMGQFKSIMKTMQKGKTAAMVRPVNNTLTILLVVSTPP